EEPASATVSSPSLVPRSMSPVVVDVLGCSPVVEVAVVSADESVSLGEPSGSKQPTWGATNAASEHRSKIFMAGGYPRTTQCGVNVVVTKVAGTAGRPAGLPAPRDSWRCSSDSRRSHLHLPG